MIYVTLIIILHSFGTICALPIPIHQQDQTSAVIFGVVVLASIGAVLGACVCCKRRKRGFELSQVKDRKEFENESGAIEGARTTEFPIFRALTPPGQNQEPPDVNPAAVIIPVHRNVILEEPEFDNNNVPISPADMENIENNNAIDYIPNRNEIAVAVSVEIPANLPEPVSPTRSIYSVNRNSENPISSVPISPSRSYQTVLDIETDAPHSRSVAVSSMSPGQSSTYSRSDSETNPFIGYAAVELVDIHIDMDGGDSIEEPLLGLPEQRHEIPFKLSTTPPVMQLNEESTAIVPEAKDLSNCSLNPDPVVPVGAIEISCMETKCPDTRECTFTDAITPANSTDFSSVEEALRELDFAISGGECLLQRDDSADDDDDIDEDEDRVLVPPDCPVNSDTISVHENEHPTVLTDNEHLQYVREIATDFVAGILVECQQIITTTLDYRTESSDAQNDLMVKDVFSLENKEFKDDQESQDSIMFLQDLSLNTTIVNVGKSDGSQENSTTHIHEKPAPCLDDSAELNESLDFETDLNFVASTPFVKLKPFDDAQTPILFMKPIQYDMATPSPEIDAVPQSNATYNAEILLEHDIAPVALDVNTETSSELRSSDETIIIAQITHSPPMPTIKIISDCDATSEDLTTATPVNTPIELNYNMDTWDKFVLKNMSQPIQSTVLTTTSFDGQEPCTSAQALAREAADAVPQANVTFDASPDSANNSGWFLHPQSEVSAAPDGTFNVEDNIDNDPVNAELEDNEENLNLTFDALRKQLAEALPHAQGSMAGPQEFSDDDDDEMDVGAVGGCDEGSYEQPNILPQKEMIISYKRPLSPIMEESEDDISCKTFVLNETKCLDSTSTGCLEGEAMGVTKTLMASNDTLFNFEDTLGDRDDMFSPRTPSAASQLDHVQSSRSSSSSIYECRTPTSTPAVASTVFTSEDMITKCNTGDERPRSNSIPNEDTVNDSFTFATGAVDLLSPDQQKTFSEDICSADLSAAADATFTTTTTTLEEKTCISVPLAAKDGLQRLSQVSEPEWGSSMLLDMSLEDIPSLNAFDDLTDDSQEQRQNSCDDLNATVILSDANTISSALSVVDKNQQNNDFDFLTAVTHFGYQTKELYQRSDADTAEKENTNPNEGTATKLENAATVEKLFFEEPDLIRNCSDQTFQDDIRFSGPSAELMSTSFSSPSNEWDSDVDESNSSEEFMFVKGPTQSATTVVDLRNTMLPEEEQQLPGTTEDSSTADIDSVWNTHHDKVPVSSSSANDEDDDDHHNGGTSEDGNDDDVDDGNSNNSSSDAEGEWVPSCWDSMAQPARSALKSPDKSSSGTTKKRRSVAFKKQHYHSVYEYPKEVSLSPAYSAPHMSWSREFDGQLRLFDGSSSSAGAAADLAGLDGFTVSSSSRPFSTSNGGSQFNAQNHTWPTSDSDFSWSQVQEDNEAEDGGHYPTYSELQIKWPKELGEFFCSEDVSDTATSADNTRPDSGVGESAELLSESISLGDLCHTKASLRLPLNFSPNATITNGISVCLSDADKSVFPIADDAMSSPAVSKDVAPEHGENDDYGNDVDELLPIQNNRNHQSDLINAILPTPSCTGSMDSLSSSSCSERQLSCFTTFGKTSHDQQQVDDRNRLNESGDAVMPKPSLVLIEDELRLTDDQTIGLTNVEDTQIGGKKATSTKQNDSTDEDSGIESIMRISKERSVNY